MRTKSYPLLLVLRLGYKKMLIWTKWLITLIFASFTTSSDVHITKTKFRNLEAKAKMRPNSETVVYYLWISGSSFVLFFVFFSNYMTHWVSKEPPMRASFTWIIKVPPGLRTRVPSFRMTKDLIALHKLSNPIPLWGFASPCSVLMGLNTGIQKCLKWNTRRNWVGLDKAGAEWGKRKVLMQAQWFSNSLNPSSEQPLFLWHLH